MTELWPCLCDVHQVVEQPWSGIASTIAAIVCGGIIGFERGRAQKPAGVRTLTLICLGSAIFTQASILMTLPGLDNTRIASNIVTGIGFLGAGAIIRERGYVIGVTTGAAIWATAAVGVVLGSGYIAAGIVFTALIFLTLTAAGKIEGVVMGRCVFKTLRITYAIENGKTRFTILGILDESGHEFGLHFAPVGEGLEKVDIEFCQIHRQHRGFLAELMTLPQIKNAELLGDGVLTMQPIDGGKSDA